MGIYGRGFLVGFVDVCQVHEIFEIPIPMDSP